MLKKLFKYEFKETSKVIPFLYLGALIACLLSLLSVFSAKNKLGNFTFISEIYSTVLLILGGIGITVATDIILAVRFYKTMYGSQGYLTMTLPATSKQLLVSKGVTAFAWSTASTVVALGTFAVALYNLFSFPFISENVGNPFAYWIDIFKFYFTDSFLPMIFVLVLSFFISSAFFISTYFLSFTIGSTGAFNKHGVGASVATYFIISFIVSIVEGIIDAAIPLYATFNEDGFSFMWLNLNDVLTDTIEKSITISVPQTVLELILCISFFVLTHYLMNRKLSMK